jgi:threonine dehydratase
MRLARTKRAWAAALTSGRYRPRPGERVSIVLCGANTIAVDFAR